MILGVAALAIASAVLAGMIGFLSNAVVPRSVDVGPASPLGEALAIDLLLVSLFGVQHSLMARGAFKRWWTRLVPSSLERSSYILAASAVLAFLMWQWRPIATPVWEVTTPIARAALWTLFAGGWLLMLVSTLELDPLSLFGLRQALDGAHGRPSQPPPFQVTGLHRLVRHPTHLGWILAVWSTPSMSAGHALLAASTSLYVLVAIRLEERDLVREHGEAYERYRQRVPMLVPWRRVHERVRAPRHLLFDAEDEKEDRQ